MGQVFSSFIENCNCGGISNRDLINDEMMGQVRQDIDTIKNNHLHHIEADMNEIKMDIKILQSALMRIESKL